ncbi:MAG: cytochrome b5-like heme/steroid binding domain-containing protein [Patescibacteria group bacterium]|jgi:cytochrome b involved in lipid metabolism
MNKVVKNIVLICLIVFAVSYAAAYFLGRSQPNQSLSNQANSPTTTSRATPSPTTSPAQNDSSAATTVTKTYAASEVAQHNSANDCWLIISGKVYNLTNYLYSHPGSASAILPYCGADGTTGYSTKDQRRASPHSSYADSLLPDYYMGDIK